MRSARIVLPLVLVLGCREAAAPPPAELPAPVRLYFFPQNASDSLINIGYRVALADTAAGTTMTSGAVLVNPIAPHNDLGRFLGPECHVGCILDIQLDNYWLQRSWRLPARIITSEGDSIVSITWPADTAGAAEVPFSIR